MTTPDPARPDFDRFIRFAAAASLELLQFGSEIAQYVFVNGGVYVPTFVKIFEKTFNMKMMPEMLENIVDSRRIAFSDEKKQCIKATFGHSGPVLLKMIQRDFMPYDGAPTVFCFTHTTHDGLGVINGGRNFNVLYEPRFCRNKGIMAYVNVHQLRQAGIELWCKAGVFDRIFCFNSDLRNHIYHLEYSPEYLSDDGLKRVHARVIDFHMKTLSQSHGDSLTYEEQLQEALNRVKRLIVSDDEVEEFDEELLESLVIA